MTTAVRGTLAWCADDPFLVSPRKAFAVEADGGVVCQGGLIVDAGPWSEVRKRLPPGTKVADRTGCVITPGFVDAHVHYVQTGIIGARSEGLLEWLRDFAYPAERAFASRAHAARVAKLFCDELLRAGTTTAMVFCSVHPASVDALFEEAGRRGLRLVAGKVLMDRNAPKDLRDTAQRGYDESKVLFRKWHGRGRLSYAITPRFAASCSPAQLEAAGALKAELAGAFVQTHVSENRDEVAWVRRLFPRRKGYLDVYEHFGLLGERSVLAHGVHLTEGELRRCHAGGTSIAHCPTSNLFLGSGLFGVHRAKDKKRPVSVALGTDVGAGTSFSMLRTLGAAHGVARLAGGALTAEQGLFLATLGGARALSLDDRIGKIAAGYEADLAVLDPRATPLLAELDRRSESVADRLFHLMTAGDERAVRETWVGGDPVQA